MELNIYDTQGLVALTVSPDSSSQWSHEIGSDNVVSLNFTTWQFITLQVGWYILVGGKRFNIKSEYRPKHVHNSKYTYNVKCYGREHDMQDRLFCRLNQGDDDLESVFAYDGTPMDFLQKVVDNMNRNNNPFKWKVGEALVANRQTINFNGLYCWDALGEIARTFNTEWWMDGEYLNLTQCVHGESVSLGYGEGLKAGLTQNENTNASVFFTRLIPVGSSKNIDRASYGYSTLQLPDKAKYIDINTQLGLREYREEAAFSEIYPHREGTISDVRTESKTNADTGDYTVYFVKDADLPFNPDEYMLGGQVIHLTFNSGNLAGKDFEVNWHNDTQEFEIINQYPDDNNQLPGGNLIPSKDDKYVLSNIRMPDEYIVAAEKEFKEAVDAFLSEYGKDTSIYSGQTDYIYITQNDVPLSVGQRVKLLSSQYFGEDGRESRITRISRKLNNLNDATFDCTDAVASSWKSSVDSSINQLQFTVAQEMAQSVINILKTWDTDEPSNYNVMSALRSLNTHLNKTRDDRSRGLIASDKGFHVGDYRSGTLGSGAAMYRDSDGNTYLESDFLSIRKKAMFTTITVQELKHVGGSLILSAAAMVCSRVEELEDGYKCYFNTTNSDGKKLFNEFEVDDQARCQTFNLTDNTYYWRLVTEVGTDYIVLSKTDCDANSDAPKAGDNISLLGNRTDPDRQKAIILSAYGPDAPSYKQYKGINSYSMEDKEVTLLSPDGNRLTGVVNIEAGSTGAQNLTDFPDEVFKAVHVGAVNLLLNSGFVGDYRTEKLDPTTSLGSDLEMYSKALKHWEGSATISTDTTATSGRTATLGELKQSVKLIADESYVVSFLAKGTSVQVSCGNFKESITGLTDNLTHYAIKFISDGNGTFSISGDATICDLQLERGTIATDWNPSPYDNDKALAEFQAIQYLSNAIKEGNTSILGGLILSSMIMLGNYKDGVMQRVNAGMSGICNDDDDVAFWAGGTFEQAIKTVVQFKQNPFYQPTEREWADLANFVATHGGDLFLRASIFAENGYFRGEVNQGNGATILRKDGSGQFANGVITWNRYGEMFRKASDNIQWVNITDFEDTFKIDLKKGTYLDLSYMLSDNLFTMPDSEYDGTIVTLKWEQASRSSECAILKGNFRIRESSSNGATYKSATKLTLSVENREFQLIFNKTDGYWVYKGEGATITDDLATIGRVIQNETETVTEVVTANKYVIGDQEGISESIHIKDIYGQNKFTFTSGLLTSYEFIPDEE